MLLPLFLEEGGGFFSADDKEKPYFFVNVATGTVMCPWTKTLDPTRRFQSKPCFFGVPMDKMREAFGARAEIRTTKALVNAPFVHIDDYVTLELVPMPAPVSDIPGPTMAAIDASTGLEGLEAGGEGKTILCVSSLADALHTTFSVSCQVNAEEDGRPYCFYRYSSPLPFF